MLTLLTALTTATFAIGHALDNHPIRVLGCVMSCLLIIGWFAVFAMMIRAVVVKDILWPQKQEDRAEGGWTAHPDEKLACDSRACEPENGSTSGLQHEHWNLGQQEQQGSLEPTGSLPVIAEQLIDENIRSRVPKQNEDMVSQSS